MTQTLDPFDWLAVCLDCGRPHHQQIRTTAVAATWADPADGHSYRPRVMTSDLAEYYRAQYLAEQVTAAEADRPRDTRRTAAGQ